VPVDHSLIVGDDRQVVTSHPAFIKSYSEPMFWRIC